MENNISKRMYPTRNIISMEARIKTIEIMSATLATTADLKSQIKQAHWNLKGINFISLHLLFDELATEMDDTVDTIAERIMALGGTAMGTVRMASISSKLMEFPTQPPGAIQYLNALADRYAVIGEHLRWGAEQMDSFGDPTTANYFLELAMLIDKRLWFIEAHIQ